jgi:endothelin-converting enzyme
MITLQQYYEEKPIMDLYTHVVADILKAVTKASAGHLERRDIWPPWWPGGGDSDEHKDGDHKKVKAFQTLAKKVVAFERELIRAGGDPYVDHTRKALLPTLTYPSSHSELLSNPTYANNPYGFHNLSNALDFVSLDDYLSAFAPRNHPNKIIVTYPPYLKALRKILAQTPDHVLSAYFATRFSLSYASLLGPRTPVWMAARSLQEVLTGLKKGTPQDRTEFCLRVVDELDGLGLLAGKEFIDRKFGGNSKATAERVINSELTPDLERLLSRRSPTKRSLGRRHRCFQGSHA